MNGRKPSVFVITCHDLGRHLGCYGIRTVRSPNLDRLAAEGVRFERAFSTAPQCSPSRASLATGRYPHSHGVMGLAHKGFDWDLNEDEHHAAALLAAHGYETHLFGHQHVTQDIHRLGFQHVHAVASRHGDSTSARGGQEVAAEFEQFVRGPAPSAPLYVEINFFEPHRPYDFGDVEPDRSTGVVVPPYLPQTPAAMEELAALQGAIRELDRAVGRVLEALDGANLAEPAMVIFSADHGLAMPRAKCTLYDPGIEVALLVRWPEGRVRPGSVRSELVGNLDVLPTILDAAGIAIPASIQGVSFLPTLRGEPQRARDAIFAEKTFHSYYDPMRCVRTDRFKYIRNFEIGFAVEVPADVQQGAIYRADPGPYATDRSQVVEFYDLEADPLEQRNLAGNPDVVDVKTALDRRLWQWMDETGDPLLQGPIASPRFHLATGARSHVAAGRSQRHGLDAGD
ncbi:MAG: sulfatase [Actinobacteria bacterium]|nr:sulfatase [Actinomycetota bacterium]